MKLNILIIASVLQFGAMPTYGQIKLCDMDLGTTDSLQKNRIHYFSPGKGGKGSVWDFSRKLGSKESCQVKFMKDSTGMVSFLESGKSLHYCVNPDSLVLVGSETPLERRDYVRKKISKKFPLKLNDSIRSAFRCEGMYCGDHPFREAGTTIVKVDAEGILILAEGDTMRNVKRVHTIDSYSVCMDIIASALDTAKLTQIIDERYEWYLQESQYPIIEDVTTTTYFNMNAIGTQRYAYCNLPEWQTVYYITPENDNPPDELEELIEPDIIHYKIETEGGVVNVKYDLDADANLATIIASHMGMTYKHREWSQKAGVSYRAQINCKGLRSGIYILYINVNGKIYSNKVII